MEIAMNIYLIAHGYIKTYVKSNRSKYSPREPRRLFRPTLPKDHPCYNCLARDRNNDTLYCFLPVCKKDFFKGDTKNEKRPTK